MTEIMKALSGHTTRIVLAAGALTAISLGRQGSADYTRVRRFLLELPEPMPTDSAWRLAQRQSDLLDSMTQAELMTASRTSAFLRLRDESRDALLDLYDPHPGWDLPFARPRDEIGERLDVIRFFEARMRQRPRVDNLAAALDSASGSCQFDCTLSWRERGPLWLEFTLSPPVQHFTVQSDWCERGVLDGLWRSAVDAGFNRRSPTQQVGDDFFCTLDLPGFVVSEANRIRNLAPWPDIRRLDRAAAIQWLAAREADLAGAVSFLGVDVDLGLLFIGGPMVLALLIGVLNVHLGHLLTFSDSNLSVVREFPWPPAFMGRAGVVSAWVMLIGIPVGACAVVVWRARLVSPRLTLIAFALLLTVGALGGWAIGLTLALRQRLFRRAT